MSMSLGRLAATRQPGPTPSWRSAAAAALAAASNSRYDNVPDAATRAARRGSTSSTWSNVSVIVRGMARREVISVLVAGQVDLDFARGGDCPLLVGQLDCDGGDVPAAPPASLLPFVDNRAPDEGGVTGEGRTPVLGH
jgi:hypothetical protein